MIEHKADRLKVLASVETITIISCYWFLSVAVLLSAIGTYVRCVLFLSNQNILFNLKPIFCNLVKLCNNLQDMFFRTSATSVLVDVMGTHVRLPI